MGQFFIIIVFVKVVSRLYDLYVDIMLHYSLTLKQTLNIPQLNLMQHLTPNLVRAVHPFLTEDHVLKDRGTDLQPSSCNPCFGENWRSWCNEANRTTSPTKAEIQSESHPNKHAVGIFMITGSPAKSPGRGLTYSQQCNPDSCTICTVVFESLWTF